MRNHLSARVHLFAAICVALLFTLSACQRMLPLQFEAGPADATTVIKLEIPDQQYRTMTGQVRTKFSLENPQMTIAGHPVKVEDIHLRGSSSMLFRRKSLSVSLEAPFYFGEEKKMKKFYLISMCMDRSYYENVFAFRCLELLNISHLYYQYAEVWINDQPEGVYLVVQRPNDYALKDLGSPYVVRRGAHDRIDGEKSSDDVSDAQADLYQHAYLQIPLMAKERHGKALYQAWEKVLDIDAYLRLLAFFYWVRNGDYADELYFYLSPEEDLPRFHLLPWDFDDIFAPEPHEGAEEKINLIGEKMLFSGEAELDQIIALDPYLYEAYLRSLKQVMEEIDEKDLQIIFQDIYTELYPYYNKPEVIEMSKYDQSRETNLERLKEDLNRSCEQMIERKEETLRKLRKLIPE
jgi:spore coat protein H